MEGGRCPWLPCFECCSGMTYQKHGCGHVSPTFAIPDTSAPHGLVSAPAVVDLTRLVRQHIYCVWNKDGRFRRNSHARGLRMKAIPTVCAARNCLGVARPGSWDRGRWPTCTPAAPVHPPSCPFASLPIIVGCSFSPTSLWAWLTRS
eukprot:scaffold45_cov337-Pavlova_lutheri.AAC.2